MRARAISWNARAGATRSAGSRAIPAYCAAMLGTLRMTARRSAIAAVLAALCAFPAAGSAAPRFVDVAMRTTLGTIVLRLDAARAPVTVANFLRYVDTHKYAGSAFYRTVRPGNQAPHRPIQVIQGGLDLPDAAPYPFGRIPLETTLTSGLHFGDGTLGSPATKTPGPAAPSSSSPSGTRTACSTPSAVRIAMGTPRSGTSSEAWMWCGGFRTPRRRVSDFIRRSAYSRSTGWAGRGRPTSSAQGGRSV